MRYLVDDVGRRDWRSTSTVSASSVVERYGPAIAIVRRDDLDPVARRPDVVRGPADARRPHARTRRLEPAVVIEVEDLDDASRRSAARRRCVFRNEVVEGPGGRQILAEDPSGNVVELFEPGA